MSSSFNIVVSQQISVRDERGRFLAAVEAGATSAAEQIADDTAQLAQLFAPKKRGVLMASIEPVMLGATTGAAIATAEHAAAQEKGASPHDIPGSFGRPFPWGYGTGAAGGSSIVDTPLWHPGNPATHYMRQAGQAMARVSAGIIASRMPG